ncbi:hypothetical protein [Paenibacillus chitinolyticus]
MFRVVYVNKYDAWVERCSSNWYKTEEEVQDFLDYLPRKTKYAQRIQVLQEVDVTNLFTMPEVQGQV